MLINILHFVYGEIDSSIYIVIITAYKVVGVHACVRGCKGAVVEPGVLYLNVRTSPEREGGRVSGTCPPLSWSRLCKGPGINSSL